jgi:hypothetical protein
MALFDEIEELDQRRAAQLAHFQQLRDEVYNSYVAAIDEDTRYYEGSFAEDIVPQEWRERGTKAVRPPTGYNAVENATDHIQKTPKIFISPRPTADNRLTAQEIAEHKRAFLRFFWQTVEAEQGDPATALTKSLVKDGMLALKFEVDWDVVPEDADERNALGIEEFAWRLTALSPGTVVPDPDRPWDPRYVYERYTVRVATALVMWPESLESSRSTGAWRNKELHDEVEVTEYWSKPEGKSKGEFVLWVDDDVVVEGDNPYHWVRNPQADEEDWKFTGWTPYIIRASGWGETKRNLEPEKLYVGILRRDRSMLEAEALHLTAASVQLMISTFPMILAFNVPDAVDMNMGPGKIIDIPAAPDEANIVAFKMPDVPAGTWQLIAQANSYSNDLTKFGALGGSAVSGVDTATESDALIRNAAVKLSGPVNALRSMYAEASKRAFQTIENVIESEVTLFGVQERGGDGLITLGPDDIAGFYRVSVQLGTSDEAALEIRNLRAWSDAKAKFRSLPESIAMEKAGIENPMAAMEMAAEEELFWSPEVQQVLKLLALNAMQDLAGPVQRSFVQGLQQAGQPQGGPPGVGDEASGEAAARVAAARIPGVGDQAIAQGQAAAAANAPERDSQ